MKIAVPFSFLSKIHLTDHPNDTRDITDYLKGIAIMSVLINHYINHYVSKNYFGYASGIISIFFILSGFGLYYSLRNLADCYSVKKAYLYFSIKRFLRILPLYWFLSLLPMVIIKDNFSFKQVVPLAPYDDVNWFIPYIFHCYIVAPFLYMLLSRMGLKQYLYGISFALVSMLVFSVLLPAFQYRNINFGYMIIFAIGLGLPVVMNKYRAMLQSDVLKLSMVFIFLLSVYYTRYLDMIFRYSSLFAFLLLAASLSVMMMSFLSNTKMLFLKNIFITFGKNSYAILLAHPLYYGFLHKLGIIKYRSLSGMAFAIILLPLLLFICSFAEKISKKVSTYIVTALHI
jgi:peptidoglycan/LPS O-acetylase OafA/YrhL